MYFRRRQILTDERQKRPRPVFFNRGNFTSLVTQRRWLEENYSSFCKKGSKYNFIFGQKKKHSRCSCSCFSQLVSSHSCSDTTLSPRTFQSLLYFPEQKRLDALLRSDFLSGKSPSEGQAVEKKCSLRSWRGKSRCRCRCCVERSVFGLVLRSCHVGVSVITSSRLVNAVPVKFWDVIRSGRVTLSVASHWLWNPPAPGQRPTWRTDEFYHWSKHQHHQTGKWTT